MKPVRILVPFVLLIFFACKKENFTVSPTALLSTTTDSLHFDTVFTTTGSVTQFFRIVNENNKGIRISSVSLAGGSSSPFRINVDGIPGPVINDLEVKANDSLYVFVTVTINPNTSNLAFVERDSIEITYNGNTQWVQLDAYGQNANFLRNHTITTNESWDDQLPYVILGKLTVSPNTILTINKGARIYMHADAPFLVEGTLLVNGEKEDSSRVVFTGDRLDEPYRHFPASYPGLVFTESSKGNILNYTIIKNAYQGIVVMEQGPGTKLTLNETHIDNAYDAGLIGINTSINASNLLVSNCGKNIMLVKGGQYQFNHCTAVALSNSFIQHRDPVLLMTNYLGTATNNLDAVFTNCIFWGEANGLVTNEVVVLKAGPATVNVSFDHILWRVQIPPSGITTNDIINNQQPLFDSINTSERIYSYRLKDGSPALNTGLPTSLTRDLDGRPRPVGLPDLGAYEKQ
ncbi:MAG: choice-of-anchor Q domain-containing protein [Flavisolibacter sp.]